MSAAIQAKQTPARVFILEVAGLHHDSTPVRYYSGPVAPASKTDTATSRVYTDVPAIVDVSNMGGRLDPRGGVAEHKSIIISLATGRQMATQPEDAGVLLGRRGHRATGWARLIVPIAQATTVTDIRIDRATTNVLSATPGAIQIDQECFWVTGTAGAGTPADPYRFTGVTRGIFGTKPQEHHVSDIEAFHPFVTHDVVFWGTRRAVLYIATVYGDGATMSTPIEVMRGFLQEAPTVSGSTVAVELVPLSAVVDRKLTAPQKVWRLAADKHYFEGSGPCTVEVAQGFKRADAFMGLAAATAAGNSSLLVPTTQPHSDCMDVTLSPGHPRNADIICSHERMVVTAYVGGPAYDLPNAVPVPPRQAVAVNETYVNAETWELIQVDLCTPEADQTAIVDWPHGLLDALNTATAWIPGSRDGLAGAWADMLLTEDGSGWAIDLTMNPDAGGSALRFRANFWLRFWSEGGGAWPDLWGEQPQDWSSGTPEPRASRRRHLSYAIDFAEPDDGRFPAAKGASGDERRGREWTREVAITANTDIRRQGIRIRGLCRAGWYESGERYILVSETFTMPAHGEVVLRIEYHDFDSGQRETAFARCVAVTEPTAGYFALEIHEDDRTDLPSFGDWAGVEPVRITPTIRLNAQPAWKVIARLLLSGGGNQINHVDLDSEPFGGDLDEDDVDIVSLQRHAFSHDEWSPFIPPGETLRKVLDPILQMNQVALTMRIVDGVSKIGLAHVGPEVASVPTDSLDATSIGVERMPDNRIDGEKYTRFEFSINHEGDGDSTVTLNFDNVGAVQAEGDGDTLEMDARGLVVDGRTPSDVLPVFRDSVAQLGQHLSHPRDQWAARTYSAKAVFLALGDVLSVTSDHLRAKLDTWGVTAAGGRVVEMDTPLWPTRESDGAETVLSHSGINATGWNAAARISVVHSVTEVEVEANVFTPTVHPATRASINDATPWAAGDWTLVQPANDWDAGAARQIDTVDATTRRIVFTAVHGAAVGDYIVPATYDAVGSAALQSLGYIADTNKGLGAAPDPGFELV